MAQTELAWRRRQKVKSAPSRDTPARSGLSEGALLALVPIGGSALAFLFESGFLFFYGIPPSFIKLDVPFIVQASILLLCTGATLALIVGLAVQWTVQRESTLKRVVGTSTPYFLFLFVLLLAFRPMALGQWLPELGAVVVILVLAVYGEAWFKGDRSQPLRVRVEAVLFREQARDETTNRKRSLTQFDKILFSVLFVAALCSFVFQSGIATAKARKTQLAMKADQTLLFVEQYGDLLLFKRFDPTTCQLLPEIQFLKVAEGAPLVLVRLQLAREVVGRDLVSSNDTKSEGDGRAGAGQASTKEPKPIGVQLPGNAAAPADTRSPREQCLTRADHPPATLRG